MEGQRASLLQRLLTCLVHFVGGLHHLRVRFIGALAHDQVDELFHHADVGLFGVALHERAQALGAARGADVGVAGRVGRLIEVGAEAVQPGGVLKIGELNLSGLCAAVWLGRV